MTKLRLILECHAWLYVCDYVILMLDEDKDKIVFGRQVYDSHIPTIPS